MYTILILKTDPWLVLWSRVTYTETKNEWKLERQIKKVNYSEAAESSESSPLESIPPDLQRQK